VRLTSFGVVGVRELSRLLTVFLRRLRRRLPFAYFRVIEFHHGHPHGHVLLRTDSEPTEELVKRLWRATGGRYASAHCAPIRDPVRMARYIVKAVKDECKKELPPEGLRVRLVAYSKAFFARPVKHLWAELVATWYPKRQSGRGTEH
jgi:hypothetical protein